MLGDGPLSKEREVTYLCYRSSCRCKKRLREWIAAEPERNKSRRMTLAYNFWQLFQHIITSI